jgi:ribosomal-protein-alanine N-acetyltransferase
MSAELWRLQRLDASRVPEILDIEWRGYPFPWTEQIVRDSLRHGTVCWGVLNPADELLAYAFFSMAVGEAHVLNICVDPAQQGQGIGRYLMQHLLELARSELCTVVLLEVRRSNSAARRLYESLGFNTLGIRKGYYPAAENSREDALVLGYEIF